jgi:hypothetical protein
MTSICWGGGAGGINIETNKPKPLLQASKGIGVEVKIDEIHLYEPYAEQKKKTTTTKSQFVTNRLRMFQNPITGGHS